MDDRAALRFGFAREIAALVPRARVHVDVLRTDPRHAEALEHTRLFFHKIAGAAASVDLEVLGRLAAICERIATLAQRGNDEGLLPYLYPIFDDGHRAVTALVQEAAAGPLPE